MASPLSLGQAFLPKYAKIKLPNKLFKAQTWSDKGFIETDFDMLQIQQFQGTNLTEFEMIVPLKQFQTADTSIHIIRVTKILKREYSEIRSEVDLEVKL